MKQLAITAALFICLVPTAALAQSPSQQRAIEQLVEALSEAYLAKDLGKLDAKRPYRGRVKIVIEHSLVEGQGQYEVKWVRTLGEGEQWLRSREEEDQTPFRENKPLLRCQRGLCTYDSDGGILHNRLYLKRIAYSYRNGRPYIKTIYLLDGD